MRSAQRAATPHGKGAEDHGLAVKDSPGRTPADPSVADIAAVAAGLRAVLKSARHRPACINIVMRYICPCRTIPPARGVVLDPATGNPLSRSDADTRCRRDGYNRACRPFPGGTSLGRATCGAR